MVPGDMYEWSWGIFAKKIKFHDAGGPGIVGLPYAEMDTIAQKVSERQNIEEKLAKEGTFMNAEIE